MNKIKKNYVSKLSLRETQEALFKIEDILKYKIIDKLELIFVRSPLYSNKKMVSSNASSNGERQINFDCSNDNSIYFLFNDYKYWLLSTLKILNIKNNNSIGTFVSYIERDNEIKNSISLERRKLEIEYRFDNKEKIFDKIQELFSIIYSIINETQEEISKQYESIKNTFPSNINKIKVNKEINIGILNEKAISEGYFILEKEFKNNSQSITSNYEISLIGFSKDILEATEIFMIKDRKTIKDIESEFSVSEAAKEEYIFGKDILNGKNPRSINISIDIDTLSMLFLEKTHILEIQSGSNIKEIEKILKEADIEHI